MRDLAQDSVSKDTVLGGQVTLLQPRSGYRIAIDPILLASVIDDTMTGRVLDAGCGTGAALFSVLARHNHLKGVGIERDEALARLAVDGLAENDLNDRASIFHQDIAAAPGNDDAAFDAVITNPPYYKAGSVPPLPNDDQAHAESELSLDAWIKACLKYLRHDGLFAVVHQAERIGDVIAALNGRTGALTVVPMWPKKRQPAKRVIVTARKGRRTPATLHPGLVLHEDDGAYTSATAAILNEGASLFSVT